MTENYQVGQETIEIHQELTTLKQTVDSWNDDEEGREEENQDGDTRVEDLPLQEDREISPETPPGFKKIQHPQIFRREPQ